MNGTKRRLAGKAAFAAMTGAEPNRPAVTAQAADESPAPLLDGPLGLPVACS